MSSLGNYPPKQPEPRQEEIACYITYRESIKKPELSGAWDWTSSSLLELG